MNQNIKFISKDRTKFFADLRKRTESYFKENQIKKSGGRRMAIKVVFMFALYFVPYFLLFTGIFSSYSVLFLYVLIGAGISGIGLSIMHDANHGSLSSNSTINKYLGLSLNIIGGNAFIWKIKHNVLHHTFTNIYGHDDDLEAAKKLIRLSPTAELHPLHKYQYMYAPFMYGLLTLMWVTVADFLRFFKFNKMGLIKKHGGKPNSVLTNLILSKIFYYGYIIVLPIVLTNIPWYFIIGGFFLMHFIAGFILSLIFQMAHIVEEADYPLPNEGGVVENEWAIHQLMTTANFSTKNKPLTWFAGGLNYQVEHHLFPYISHVHYPALSKIIKETTSEYNIPYHEYGTFFSALKSHIRMLKRLGYEKQSLQDQVATKSVA